ncbi:MAG TPA: TRAP transporter TatT component family protein [Blastocatellia bacterium]|jgi:hypothetical protein|nr:TRAP transporter TatT component family protein [Blastocatellia bacterium]
MGQREDGKSESQIPESRLPISDSPTPPLFHSSTLPLSDSPTPPLSPSPLLTLDRVDDLYRRRGQPCAVEESVSLLTNFSDATQLYEVQWRLSRSLFFLGQCAEASDEKQQFHSDAVHAGKRATSLSPGRVEGHFWLGVNLALFAETSGGLRAACALLRARRELKRSAAISESYHGAGPLRVLGRLEHHAPIFLGGSRKRSLGYFERALAATANSVTMIYAAELLLLIGDRPRASDLLQKIISLPVDPEWEFENIRDRKLAQSMLDNPASGL